MADEFRPEEDDRIIRSSDPVRVRGRRRMLTTIVAAVVLLGFGVVLVYAYNKGRQDGESKAPPVIQAQEGPTKIRPEAPGGMQVPDRDKEVFTRLEAERQSQKVERLLPPPERPMTPPAAPEPAPAEQKLEPAAGTEAQQTASNPPAPPKMEPPAEAKAPEPPAPPKPAAETKPAPKPAEKVAAVPPRPAAAPKSSGEWRIQLASLRTDDAARKYWAAQSGKNSDVLGPLTLKVERTEIAGKGTFYRVQASGLASRAAASDVCAKLKQRKLGCIVVAP